MKIWERHGPLELPVYVGLVILRRGCEQIRLWYWRTAFGWSIGRGVRVHWSVSIPRRLKVRLADGVSIAKGVIIHVEVEGGALTIGDHANVADGCSLDASGELTLGRNVTLSSGAKVFTHSHGRNPRSPPKAYALRVEDDVWLCNGAMILASTKIVGARSVIGPYAVVREPVPEGAMIVTTCDVYAETGASSAPKAGRLLGTQFGGPGRDQ